VSFIRSTTASQGYTVAQRLEIVKAAATDTACIRLSSNWLAATACYFLIACGLPAPFDPRHLTHIS